MSRITFTHFILIFFFFRAFTFVLWCSCTSLRITAATQFVTLWLFIDRDNSKGMFVCYFVSAFAVLTFYLGFLFWFDQAIEWVSARKSEIDWDHMCAYNYRSKLSDTFTMVICHFKTLAKSKWKICSCWFFLSLSFSHYGCYVYVYIFNACQFLLCFHRFKNM